MKGFSLKRFLLGFAATVILLAVGIAAGCYLLLAAAPFFNLSPISILLFVSLALAAIVGTMAALGWGTP